jgi:hypothetical protein
VGVNVVRHPRIETNETASELHDRIRSAAVGFLFREILSNSINLERQFMRQLENVEILHAVH